MKNFRKRVAATGAVKSGRNLRTTAAWLLGVLLFAGAAEVSAQATHQIHVAPQLSVDDEITVSLPYYGTSNAMHYRITVVAEQTELQLLTSAGATPVDNTLSGTLPDLTAGTIDFKLTNKGSETLDPGTYILQIEMFSKEPLANPDFCVASANFEIVIATKPIILPFTSVVWCNSEASKILTGTFETTSVANAEQVAYSWTVSTNSIGATASSENSVSNDNSISIDLSAVNNMTSAPVVLTYTVTPYATYAGVEVSGDPQTVTVTVLPDLASRLTLTAASDNICNNTNASLTIGSTVSATEVTILYEWKRKAAVTGIDPASAGTDWVNIGVTKTFTDLLINTTVTGEAKMMTYEAKQTYTHTSSLTVCTATTEDDVTVQPYVPAVTLASESGIICNNGTGEITLNGSLPGLKYDFIVADAGDKVSNEANDSDVSLTADKLPIKFTSDTKFELTDSQVEGQLVYTIEPYFWAGAAQCPNTSAAGEPLELTYTLTVLPTPEVTLADLEICNAATATIALSHGLTTTGIISYGIAAAADGTTFTTGGEATDETIPATGTSTDWETPALTQGGTDYAARTYTVTPSVAKGSLTCPGTGTPVEVTVVPTLNVQLAPASNLFVCSEDDLTTLALASNNSSAVQSGMSFAWTLDGYDAGELEVKVDGTAKTGVPATGTGTLSNAMGGMVVLTNHTTDPIQPSLDVAVSYVTDSGAICSGQLGATSLTVNPKPVFFLGTQP